MEFRYKEKPKWDWNPKTELERTNNVTDYENHNEGITEDQAEVIRSDRRDSWKSWAIRSREVRLYNKEVRSNRRKLVTVLTVISFLLIFTLLTIKTK